MRMPLTNSSPTRHSWSCLSAVGSSHMAVLLVMALAFSRDEGDGGEDGDDERELPERVVLPWGHAGPDLVGWIVSAEGFDGAAEDGVADEIEEEAPSGGEMSPFGEEEQEAEEEVSGGLDGLCGEDAEGCEGVVDGAGAVVGEEAEAAAVRPMACPSGMAGARRSPSCPTGMRCQRA